MGESNGIDSDLVTITFTRQELRVAYRALVLSSTMLDALGQARRSTLALELAYRLLPGGIRDDEDES